MTRTALFLKSLSVLVLFLVPGMAIAQDNSAGRQPSTCLAIANNLHDLQVAPVQYANLIPSVTLADLDASEVAISYQGHSTYLIESAKGIKIATDFAGWMIDKVTPTVVTMNQAHSSHYTDFPDPAIKHVLRGWAPDGPAQHYLAIEDVLVRNVTTDIMRFATVPDGNSIFIFEVAGLCIGHLGHLHHPLTDTHYAAIGRLDVVMAPVDGGLTLSHIGMSTLLKRLRASVVLPMHVRSAGALPLFLSHVKNDFEIVRERKNELILSLRTLPKRPTVVLLPGVN